MKDYSIAAGQEKGHIMAREIFLLPSLLSSQHGTSEAVSLIRPKQNIDLNVLTLEMAGVFIELTG